MQTKFKSKYSTVVKASPEKVWKALTDPVIVKKYFFGTTLDTDWKVGSPIYFRGSYEGKSYEDKGRILEYEPMSRISYSYLSSWSGMKDEPENYLLVSYQLKPVEDGTNLIITQTNYDEDRVQHSMENWKMVIEGMKKLLE